MAKTRVHGTSKLIKQLQDFSKEGAEQAAGAVKATAERISELAKKRASDPSIGDTGKVSQSIQPEKVNVLNWEVVAQESIASYAPYVEFGTGPQVQVPAEMQEVASAIKNNPKGTFQDGLEAMEIWCNNNGKPIEMAWVYLMNVIKHGHRPRPFMYPAFVQGSKELEQNLKKSLEALTRKFNAQK